MNGKYVTGTEDAEMGPAFAENASARHAGTKTGETANGQHSTFNFEHRTGDCRQDAGSTLGINVAAWANQGNAYLGGRIAERRANGEFEQVGTSAFAKELRRDTRDARRRLLEAGEQKFVEALMKFTAGAKRSQEPEVAVAARRWEGKIHFHVRAALSRRSASQRRARRGRRSASQALPFEEV